MTEPTYLETQKSQEKAQKLADAAYDAILGLLSSNDPYVKLEAVRLYDSMVNEAIKERNASKE